MWKATKVIYTEYWTQGNKLNYNKRRLTLGKYYNIEIVIEHNCEYMRKQPLRLAWVLTG